MNFIEQLKNNHLKVTPQRLAILEEIEIAGHIDVESLFEILKISFASISLATIYKNVNQLYELKILDVVKVPHQKVQYEITKAAHIHLACDACGSVIDMNQSVETLLASAENESGYQLNHSSVVFNGLCPTCQRKSA